MVLTAHSPTPSLSLSPAPPLRVSRRLPGLLPLFSGGSAGRSGGGGRRWRVHSKSSSSWALLAVVWSLVSGSFGFPWHIRWRCVLRCLLRWSERRASTVSIGISEIKSRLVVCFLWIRLLAGCSSLPCCHGGVEVKGSSSVVVGSEERKGAAPSVSPGRCTRQSLREISARFPWRKPLELSFSVRPPIKRRHQDLKSCGLPKHSPAGRGGEERRPSCLLVSPYPWRRIKAATPTSFPSDGKNRHRYPSPQERRIKTPSWRFCTTSSVEAISKLLTGVTAALPASGSSPPVMERPEIEAYC
jgi:hypothetical protein